MKLKTFVKPLSCALALGSVLFSGALLAKAESTDPIKITLHDWTGQHITSKLMGKVLSKAGYNVEFVVADYIAQFAGLETGDLHVAMELWETTAREAMDKAFATGDVVNLGETGMSAVEDWWYPSYMEEQCPGLPDWTALKECAEVFSTPETQPNGRYLGGPVTWGGYDDERVESLDLDFEVVHAGTDAALFAELESAYQRKAPILLWVYAPHWVPAKYEGSWVKFPDYTADCYNDPKWGSNPKMKYDCGKPKGPIWKAGWVGLEKQWPGAHKAIKAFNISNEEMSAMIIDVDLKGQKIDAVVDSWISSNEARWKSWI
jgi:glycine betaine/proline transport system substrate-binding protein